MIVGLFVQGVSGTSRIWLAILLLRFTEKVADTGEISLGLHGGRSPIGEGGLRSPLMLITTRSTNVKLIAGNLPWGFLKIRKNRRKYVQIHTL
jgi:hypothetical protein